MVHLKESGIEVWVGLGNKSTKGRKAKEYDVTTTQENNVVTTTCVIEVEENTDFRVNYRLQSEGGRRRVVLVDVFADEHHVGGFGYGCCGESTSDIHGSISHYKVSSCNEVLKESALHFGKASTSDSNASKVVSTASYLGEIHLEIVRKRLKSKRKASPVKDFSRKIGRQPFHEDSKVGVIGVCAVPGKMIETSGQCTECRCVHEDDEDLIEHDFVFQYRLTGWKSGSTQNCFPQIHVKQED